MLQGCTWPARLLSDVLAIATIRKQQPEIGWTHELRKTHM